MKKRKERRNRIKRMYEKATEEFNQHYNMERNP